MPNETEVVARIVERTGETLLQSADGQATEAEMTFGRNLVKAIAESLRLAKDDWQSAKEQVSRELQELQEQLDRRKASH